MAVYGSVDLQRFAERRSEWKKGDEPGISGGGGAQADPRWQVHPVLLTVVGAVVIGDAHREPRARRFAW